MAEQFQRSVQTSQDGVPQLDAEEYFSAIQQVMGNPQFMSMAEKLGTAIMQVKDCLLNSFRKTPNYLQESIFYFLKFL
jgi:hypothetical protein